MDGQPWLAQRRAPRCLKQTIYGTPDLGTPAANYTVEVTSISGATATFVLEIEVLEPVEQIMLTLPLTSLDLTNNSAMQPFTGKLGTRPFCGT